MSFHIKTGLTVAALAFAVSSSWTPAQAGFTAPFGQQMTKPAAAAPVIQVQTRKKDHKKARRKHGGKDPNLIGLGFIGSPKGNDGTVLLPASEGGGIRKILPYKPTRFFSRGGGGGGP